MSEMEQLGPEELKDRMNRGEALVILDVREPEEIEIAPFPGSTHIPMGDLPARIMELDPEQATVVVCHHGVRSAQVSNYLAQSGFERVINLKGGIDAWSIIVDSSIPRY